MHEPMILRRTLFAAAAATALTLAYAGTASADSLVYVKNEDVWLAQPDGSGQRQVTGDDTAGAPYVSPTQADDGTIVALRGKIVLRLDRQGKVLSRFEAITARAPGGPAGPCCELVLAALDGGALLAHDLSISAMCAIITLVSADRPEALEQLAQAIALAHARGSLQDVYSAHSWQAMAMLRRGELDEAAEQLAVARDAVSLLPPAPHVRAYLTGQTATVLVARGDLAGARAALAAGAGAGAPVLSDATRCVREAELELLLAEGDHAAVIAAADRFASTYDGWVVNPVHARWRAIKALALAAQGRTGEGIALVEEEAARARTVGAPGALASALRSLGVLTGGAAGIALLEQSVATAAGTPARLEHVRSLHALGRTLRLARRPTEARDPLSAALEFSATHGIDGLAEAARAELAATGLRPRRDVFSGAGALTPSERRAADLATGGVTNREIAQELYVTPKTVEVHLSSAYRKLGIRSRRELARALDGADPLGSTGA